MAVIKPMDRTDRRGAGRQILHSEAAFRSLIESVHDYAILMLDPQGIIVTWNPGAERIKGYSADEIIGQHFSVFYPAEDLQAGKPEFELAVASRTGRFEDENWRLRKDGSRFWANVTITRLNDEAGNLIGFGKITRDLTERRRAEQRYRQLIESVSDYAIFSLDPSGIVTSWNLGAERIKGYSAEEIIGQHFSRFYPPEYLAAGLPAYVLAQAEQNGHWEGEGWRLRKDGSRFWSSAVVTAIRDEDGDLVGFSKVTRDITDRKLLLDQIKEHAAKLELRVKEREQTNADLEAFSYSVSHDLRAPLRAIQGFASALKEDYADTLDATATSYLTTISDSALRMNRLVHDLLNYSRLNRIDIESQPVSVAEALEQARLELADSPGEIAVHVAPGLQVAAHESTLVQVLFNLLSNALKFHLPEVIPKVAVTAAPLDDGSVRISITDNGIGIAPQHQERIFNVFERLHGQETYPGTGIGLAIVKRGMQRMHGKVGLQSADGDGSTFWVELPAVNA